MFKTQVKVVNFSIHEASRNGGATRARGRLDVGDSDRLSDLSRDGKRGAQPFAAAP